jgi:hypothetical protein
MAILTSEVVLSIDPLDRGDQQASKTDPFLCAIKSVFERFENVVGFYPIAHRPPMG